MGQTETKFLNSAVQAIKNGNEHKLKELLANFKEFIDSHDTEGNTLLIIGVQNIQVNMVKMLLDAGADVNAPDSRGMTALHYAVASENEAIVQMLVSRGSYLNGRNDNFETPLSVAVAQQNVNIVDILLQKHANVNISDAFGNTPLHCAATLGVAEIVKSLLEQGKEAIDLNAKNVEGYTPLMLAIKNGFEDIALDICAKGPDLTLQGDDNVPPIIAAVSQGYMDLVRHFIKNNVDVNVTDGSNNTPLIIAIDAGHEKLAVELIENGASTTVDGHSRSPLHRSVEKNQKMVVCSLLDHGADLTCQDAHGNSPFLVGVKHGLGDLVTLLIDRGAAKEDMYKGLRMAASKGHKDVVKRILSVLDSEDVLTFLMQSGGNLSDSCNLEDDKNCVVCMENPRDAVIVPCGHTACCSSCLDGLPEPRLCPICRVEVRIAQKIYRV